MSFANSHFQPIGELPGEYGFTLWGFGTLRDEADVMAPRYFQPLAHHMAVGDLLLIRHSPPNAMAAPPSYALCMIDKDALGRVALHEIWRVRLADLRAAAAGAT